MRNQKIVLDNLAKQSRRGSYHFERLYRNLYNLEFYLIAYEKIQANGGALTRGTDNETIDGFSLEKVENLIESIKTEEYQPNPVRRVYIKKKAKGKLRPLGIPSFYDKLLQEVVRSILESIYDVKFSEKSHGYRPNKSCHTALVQVQETFTATRWFVEGDITGFFDNIDHHSLMQILRKNIKDDKFLRLIWKFLRAGYCEEWNFHKTYSGTPQGGILSPILSNIYLNELDKFVEGYKSNFDKGTRRTEHQQYGILSKRINRRRKKLKDKNDILSTEEKHIIETEIKQLSKERLKYPSTDPMDTNYKRLQYVRYADDFLIGIIGSKEDALRVKHDLTEFLRSSLKLELSQEKTLITNSKKMAHFLGYNIAITRDESLVKRNGEFHSKSRNLRCTLYLSREKWINKLLEYGAVKYNEEQQMKSSHRPSLRNLDDLEIISTYNAEIRGLYGYYKLAKNVSTLHKFKYFMEYSMYKTFANKYKSSVPKVIKKFKVKGTFGIKYQTAKGEKFRKLYDEGFKREKSTTKELKTYEDTLANTIVYKARSGLMKRLLANVCEYCGNNTSNIEMHHVKKLKNLKGKKNWEKFMIARNRKTLALCKKCHVDLHAGKLD
ncbi:reverse transcriptase domain-containing protein [Metabacillus fastidiosus]|uniref:reverse transcriptase/maturase family protein n=1 Tax=Metabacillus fastidiosus TaxID=1458 RepID=UPI003D275F6B